MKFLFKKRREKPTEVRENRLSDGIDLLFNRLQSGWAKWMERRTSGLSSKSWKVILGIFIICTCGYSIYIAADGIATKSEKTISIITIKKPEHLTDPSDEISRRVSMISPYEYGRIQKFRLYMDSLSRSPAGQLKHDSILHNHPGLMDSLRFIEKYYQLQIKNK